MTRRELPAAGSTPVAALFDLFVAGRSVARSALRIELEPLAALGLCDLGERVTPRATILPVGDGFVVCDRATWPDDSSYHLAACLPGAQVGRWIDLGCGSAFAAIARPNLAREVAGVELVAQTARYAELSALLSGRALAVGVGDLAAPHPWAGTCDLVSCNMPIPDGIGDSPWHSTDRAAFDRLWPAARALLAPGGTVVVHGELAALHAGPRDGERVVIAYTPPDASIGFGVAWWSPDAPARDHRATRLLTPARPHLDARDLLASAAGACESRSSSG